MCKPLSAPGLVGQRKRNFAKEFQPCLSESMPSPSCRTSSKLISEG